MNAVSLLGGFKWLFSTQNSGEIQCSLIFLQLGLKPYCSEKNISSSKFSPKLLSSHIIYAAYMPYRKGYPQNSVGFPLTPPNNGTPYPYYPHTHSQSRIPKDMGSLYGSRLPRGGPMSVGVPGITFEKLKEATSASTISKVAHGRSYQG